ncbi:hypothetical protein FHU32_000823 [Corynebacterium bovis DSM 20582 = CIP 54.80]|uniref:Uncharacterized protein n=1 Tax=Corynebacterium bovis DSM 20582 = CIP 54.80 TaxID=927655 RepID=A0A8H9Y5Y8_9CORY|nr:hypothetical protein [Corynebacterium bovis DSM 20582 = CIP 54.80]
MTSFVTARFSPWSMRNALSVMRKLGIPVRVTSHPLRAPIARETTSAPSEPTQVFRWRL